MKLPKGFGGQGFGGMLNQMQGAMARAQTLEQELEKEILTHELNGVKVKLNGVGDVLSLSIAPELVDPDDVEGLEAAVSAAVIAGIAKSKEIREVKTKEILGDLPDIPGITR